jgi:hypothetical protein
MEIDKIIILAIPAETCPIKNQNAMWRREELRKRIEELLKERDKSKPYQPPLEYKATIPY